MLQKTFILYNESNEYVADKMRARYLIDCKVYSPNLTLTAEILLEIANKADGYFYVINTDKEIEFVNFSFTYYPPEWDSKYVHFWSNSGTVRLYNSIHVNENIDCYVDDAMHSGKMEMKLMADEIYSYPIFDIVYLSYDELYADENFKILKKRFPRAKHVHGVKGILEAHKEASKHAETDMFFVVDADAEIVADFDFSYQPHSLDRLSVHVWHSHNPVNGLEYGYGGVKLFPRSLLVNYTGSPVDFTTSVSASLKVIPEVSNITKFNTDPFSTWRSAFRECAKLSSKIDRKSVV